jgi:hypothetical protein
MNVNTAESPAPASTGRPSRLWWWFVLAFVVQAAVWAAWLTIASHHRVEEVPLITNGR